MKKRKVIISAAGILILVVSFGSFDLWKPSEKETNKKTPETIVSTQKVSLGEAIVPLMISGRVISSEVISLTSEVSGIVSFNNRKSFKAGHRFKRGAILLKVDTKEIDRVLKSSRSDYKAAIARILPDLEYDYPKAYDTWAQYLDNIFPENPLPEPPEVQTEQLRLFLTSNNIFSSYYSISEQEVRRENHIVRTPFDGAITEASVEENEWVSAGQRLGTFMRTNRMEITSSVQKKYLPYLQIGKDVHFIPADDTIKILANLKRINYELEPTNQRVGIFFQSTDNRLMPGMYLNATIPIRSFKNVSVIPERSLVENDFVFVVQDGKATKVKVRVLNRTNDEAIVKGLSSDQRVIIGGHNAALEGKNISIN